MEKVILQGLGGCPICLETLGKVNAKRGQEVISKSDAEYVPRTSGIPDVYLCSLSHLTPQAKAEFTEAVQNAPATSKTYQKYLWY